MFRKKKRKRLQHLAFEEIGWETAFYRELGLLFLKPGFCRDKSLAGIFLKKAMEMGDEKSYLLYHRYFSRKKKVIDDQSYQEIYKDYKGEKNKRKKRILKEYLRLGTKRQKRICLGAEKGISDR